MKIPDYPSISVSTVVAASPETLWRLVSDIDTPSKFSSEFRGASWLTSEPHGVGSTFEGHNGRGEATWSTFCTVTAYVPGVIFTYVVDRVEEPLAVWSFVLNPEGRATRLTFTATVGLGESGLSRAVERDPQNEDDIVAARLAAWRSNMAATVQGLKALAEAASRDV